MPTVIEFDFSEPIVRDPCAYAVLQFKYLGLEPGQHEERAALQAQMQQAISYAPAFAVGLLPRAPIALTPEREQLKVSLRIGALFVDALRDEPLPSPDAGEAAWPAAPACPAVPLMLPPLLSPPGPVAQPGE